MARLAEMDASSGVYIHRHLERKRGETFEYCVAEKNRFSCGAYYILPSAIQ